MELSTGSALKGCHARQGPDTCPPPVWLCRSKKESTAESAAAWIPCIVIDPTDNWLVCRGVCTDALGTVSCESAPRPSALFYDFLLAAAEALCVACPIAKAVCRETGSFTRQGSLSDHSDLSLARLQATGGLHAPVVWHIPSLTAASQPKTRGQVVVRDIVFADDELVTVGDNQHLCRWSMGGELKYVLTCQEHRFTFIPALYCTDSRSQSYSALFPTVECQPE